MFGQLVRGWADLVLPGTSYLERDGTYVNLEGRPPAPAPRGHPARRPTSSPGWPSWRSASTSSSRRIRRRSSRRSRREPSAGCPSARSASRRRFRRARARRGSRRRPAATETKTAGGGPLRLLRFRPLFSGPGRGARPRAAVPAARAGDRAGGRGRVVAGDRERRRVRVSSNGTSVELRARVSKKLRAGVARAAEEHTAELQAGVEVSRA